MPDPASARAPARSRAAHVWGEVWRVLLAAFAGLVGLLAIAWEYDTGQRVFPPDLWAVDFLVGLCGLPLLLLRRRAPLTIALLLAAASAVSITVVGASAIAAISLATTRRWWAIVGLGVVFNVAGWVYGRTHPPTDGYGPLFDVIAGTLSYALLVWIGAYIGLRREHLQSLRERAETAEREQTSRIAQARSTERARIAREMHDVLAHRMSLVAMHAGALAYRTDLPPEKVAETAGVVQSNAHAALTELREVLGVLRDPSADPVEAGPEAPQPTLEDLDDLLAEARASGVEVHLVRAVGALDGLAESVSRHAYRIVQEGLTNARKHAPWAPVTVRVEGAPGEGLELRVRNPVRTVGPAREPEPVPPASGLGLLGLAERAELSGGRLVYGQAGGAFVLHAWLPWAS